MSHDKKIAIIDGNEAAAHIAYLTNEVAAIYPITPSSNMGECRPVDVRRPQEPLGRGATVEMQSEGGAAAVHGAAVRCPHDHFHRLAGPPAHDPQHVQDRRRTRHLDGLPCLRPPSPLPAPPSSATTRTSWPAARSAGPCWPPTASREVMDTAHCPGVTLKARVLFLHFFDGFRTSHEVSKIQLIADDIVRKMIKDELVGQPRARALNPEKPFIRGTAQNPDVYEAARRSTSSTRPAPTSSRRRWRSSAS